MADARRPMVLGARLPPDPRVDPPSEPPARLPEPPRSPSVSSSLAKHVGAHPTLLGVAAIVTALGSVVATLAKPTGASNEALHASTRQLESKLDRVLTYLEGQHADQATKDAITAAVLCAVNGGSPARGVQCPVAACEPRPIDAGPGVPLCRAREEWPPPRRPP